MSSQHKRPVSVGLGPRQQQTIEISLYYFRTYLILYTIVRRSVLFGKRDEVLDAWET